MSDNWSLENIAELMSDGLSDGTYPTFIIDEGKNCYHKIPISKGIIQIETLFDFITDIVLRDQLVFDENFSYELQHNSKLFGDLKKAGVLTAFNFLKTEKTLLVHEMNSLTDYARQMI